MSDVDLTKWILKGKSYVYCNGCQRFTPHGRNEVDLYICFVCTRVHRTRDLKNWLNWDWGSEYENYRKTKDYRLMAGLLDVS